MTICLLIMFWVFVYALVGKLSYLLMCKYDYPSSNDGKDITAVLWVFIMPITFGLLFPSICIGLYNYVSLRVCKGKK